MAKNRGDRLFCKVGRGWEAKRRAGIIQVNQAANFQEYVLGGLCGYEQALVQTLNKLKA